MRVINAGIDEFLIRRLLHQPMRIRLVCVAMNEHTGNRLRVSLDSAAELIQPLRYLWA